MSANLLADLHNVTPSLSGPLFVPLHDSEKT